MQTETWISYDRSSSRRCTARSADNAHARAVELPQRLKHADFRDRHRRHTIDTTVVCFGDTGSKTYPDTYSMISRRPAGTLHWLVLAPPQSKPPIVFE
jgi:hypothetical protein